jgi:uncharacterized membrane protein
MKNYFLKQVSSVQESELKMDIASALICYILLIYGINYFIIKPNKSVSEAFWLGIMVYGVFETTNKALFKKWSWLTVTLDTLWGGILFALTTGIVKKIR